MQELVLGLLLSCLIATAISVEDSTLVVTNVLFRHGDRAPTEPMPIDKHGQESDWPYGWGELTDIGKRQQYRLGKFFRTRYGKLVGDKFDYKQIEVRSSDKDRCLVSAYSNLAGLYSNQSEEAKDIQLPFFRWQPVPVHTAPTDTDEVLAMERPCKLEETELDRVFNTYSVVKINADYAEFFKLLSNNTGVDLGDNGFRNMWPISDSLYCESVHYPPLPDWAATSNVSCNGNTIIPCANKKVFDILREMNDYQFFVMYNSSELHKLQGGPLLEDVSKKFLEYAAGNRSITFNMYSAHDTTVSAVLNALGVFDMKQPQYTAAVMIELHKMQGTGDFEVKVFYKPITDNVTVIPKPLPGCAEPCKLEDFVKLANKFKITNWDEECGNATPTTPAQSSTVQPGLTQEEVVVIAICSTIVVVMLIILLIICTRRRSSGNAYVQIVE